MGIWSVVLATTSAARISEIGLTGSVVKFVAKYAALDDVRKVNEVIQTAVLSLALVSGMILGLVYLPSLWVLRYVLPLQAMPMASEILPFALISLWLSTIGGVLQSGLDGCQRTDLRALFNIINSVLTLLLAVIFVPRYGLLGLAYTQVALAGLLLLLGWAYLKSELTSLPVVPCHWKHSIFKEMLGYGISFQLIGFISMLFDPVTKGLLSKFGGLSMVTYFEMASRMVTQFRGLLTAPNQVLVPVIATLHERDIDRIQTVYRDSYRLQVYLSLPLYAGILSASPWVSRLWIGYYQPAFVMFSLLVTIGYLVNSLINPAYFCNLGTGQLRWNTLGNVAIGVLNTVLGVGFGIVFGGTGVVIGWILALSLGSFVVLIAFHHDHRISYRKIFPTENAWLMASCIVGILISWLSYCYLQSTFATLWIALVCSLAFLASIFLPGWRHPMRTRLLDLARR